jgi:hypothetical protein
MILNQPAPLPLPVTSQAERARWPRVAEDLQVSRLTLGLRCTGLVMAACQAWLARYSMNPDGISYLDLADAYLRGDFHAALNAYWSPAYSWLLGLALLAFRPSAEWEFTVVHFVNFLAFLAGLASFEFFLRQLLASRRLAAENGSGPYLERFPDLALAALLYSLFIWTSCYLIGLTFVTPDLCVAGIVYLAAGVIVRFRRQTPGLPASAAFGAILGIGYLVKAVLLPLGMVFLVIEACVLAGRRGAFWRIAISTSVFGLMVGTFATALSLNCGRRTFGDTAKLNYIWYANQVGHFSRRDDGELNGARLHPRRLIFPDPPVYEFAGSVRGTYPLWYDPAFWCEGLTWRFDLGRQARAVRECLRCYYTIVASDLSLFVVGIAILAAFCFFSWQQSLASRGKLFLGALMCEYHLFLLPLAAVSMYALVHVEGRFLGAFAVMFAAALLCSLRLPVARAGAFRDLSAAVVLTVGIALAAQVVCNAKDVAMAWMSPTRRGNENRSWRIAAELNRCGLRAGDVIGYIGNANECAWARLGRMQIIAQIDEPEEPAFHSAGPGTRAAVLEAFRNAGVAAVVARGPDGSLPGWMELPGSQMQVFLFPRASPPGRATAVAGSALVIPDEPPDSGLRGK